MDCKYMTIIIQLLVSYKLSFKPQFVIIFIGRGALDIMTHCAFIEFRKLV